MNYILRRLTAKDLDALRALNIVFGRAFDDSKTYMDNQPSDEYLRRFLGNEHHIVLVAENDGEVIGGLVAFVLDKFEQERCEIYIYDLAVASNARRMGVGAGLIQRLQEMATEIGAYVVFVQADEGDAAVDFYESLEPTENVRTRSFDYPPR